MKNHMLKLFCTIAFLVFFATGSFSQPPPPERGQDDNQPAPVGSGLVILLSLGAAYGAKKVYDGRRKISN